MTQKKIEIAREVQILSKINHLSVLNLILFSPTNSKNKDKPVIIIITELATNGILSDFIESTSPKKLTFTQKLIIVYGICSDMSYLHLHAIIHRDLKPYKHIYSFLFAKISDFGLSKIKYNIIKIIWNQQLAYSKGHQCTCHQKYGKNINIVKAAMFLQLE